MAPSTISKHLSLLFQAGLVESRKEGRWIYYRLPGAKSPLVGETLGWVERSLARDPQISADKKQLKEILKQDLAVLCQRQRC